MDNELIKGIAVVIGDYGRDLLDYSVELEALVGNDDDVVAIIDRVSDMPINDKPFHPDFVRNFGREAFWPIRGESIAVYGRIRTMPEKVTGITIHHTLSHSPLATARYCTATKGYPTTQYHYWVSQSDGCPIYQLAEDKWALWHDHTGTFQTTLSVGMAGALHLKRPPDEQIEAAARLCAWLMKRYSLDILGVTGHHERAAGVVGTVCPGWHSTGWKEDFFDAI